MSKSASSTPAPLVDRIRGSRKNKAGSAESKKSAQGIKLNASIIAGLTKKAKEYNDKHPKGKVSVTTLKAVMRRGMGAYSSSHRPTITGGAPNTRQAWAYARVNAFLRKKGGQGAKPTYVQDNDLLENGGTIESFKKVKETHLGTDQSFEGVAYKYKEATIYYNNVDKVWVLTMQKNGKPQKTIGGYKTLKNAQEVGLYYLNNPNLYGHGGEVALLKVGQILHLRRLPMFKRSGDLGKQREVNKKVVEVISKESWIDEDEANQNNKHKTSYFFKADDNKKYSATFWGNDLISVSNDKVRYEAINNKLAHGGQLGKEITCVNCGWHWNTNDSDPSDKYVCHKCGYDNRTYYDSEPIGKMAHGGLTKTLAVADIHKKYPELPKKYINAQLYIGMKFEMEHTKNPDVAKKIALDHLNESPFYYEYLTKMERQLEGLDVKKHYEQVKDYAKGGEINPDNKGVKDYFAHGSGNVGGVLVGKRHSEGGIKAVNKSTNQPLEMEGGEVVITRNAVSDNEKREFEGEMLTNREILSRINESGGGVSFADGGDIPESIHTSGKEYAYGGKMVKDHDIVSSCGCKHTMAEGGKIYGQGGVVRIISKEVPTYLAFQELFNGLKVPDLRKEYEGFLKENYKINFTQLPQKVRTGLLLGSQKLIDNYINA